MVGGAAAVAAAPVVGFGAAMAPTAAGGIVATLQSVGAAGLGAAGTAAAAAAGAGAAGAGAAAVVAENNYKGGAGGERVNNACLLVCSYLIYAVNYYSQYS